MKWQDYNPAEDVSSDKEKIEKYLGEIDWSYLEPHYQAGNLVYVDPCLDLNSAGLAISSDNQQLVMAWLKSGDLVKPCDLHVQHWKKMKVQFKATIVRPFILIQPEKLSEGP